MDIDFKKRSIYAAISGSQIHGTDLETSDIDIRVVFVPQLEMYSGSKKLQRETFGRFLNYFDADGPEVSAIESAVGRKVSAEEKLDTMIMDLEHFFRLADDGNGTMIDLLFVEPRFRIITTPLSDLLLANRHLFLTPRTKLRYYAFALFHLRQIRYLWQECLSKSTMPQVTRECFGLPPESLLSDKEALTVVRQAASELEKWLAGPDVMPDNIRMHPNALTEVVSAWYNLTTGGFRLAAQADDLQPHNPRTMHLLCKQPFEWDEIASAALVPPNSDLSWRFSQEWHYRSAFEMNRWANKVINAFRSPIKFRNWCGHVIRRLRLVNEMVAGEEPVLYRVGRDAQTLLDIRNGKWSFDQVLAEIDDLNARLNTTFLNGGMPRVSVSDSGRWNGLFKQMLGMATADSLRRQT